ncbi:hypothetical protein AUP68_08787 [Ilyonectria robusta]
MGKPAGIENADNVGIILVAEGQTGLTVSVSSGSTVSGTNNLVEGFNKFAFADMTTGTVMVEVHNGDAVVVKGSGPIPDAVLASTCAPVSWTASRFGAFWPYKGGAVRWCRECGALAAGTMAELSLGGRCD